MDPAFESTNARARKSRINGACGDPIASKQGGEDVSARIPRTAWLSPKTRSLTKSTTALRTRRSIRRWAKEPDVGLGPLQRARRDLACVFGSGRQHAKSKTGVVL